MGLFGNKGQSKVVGAAVTSKGREQKALKSVVKSNGVDPEHLEYVEDKRSKTAKVVNKDTGKTLGRFGW